ncbi:MAG: hypothetical protein NZM25_06210 [Leptospiraceae bacterium]|nr:hypothetical protein [Leptospiraceae bacterium]
MRRFLRGFFTFLLVAVVISVFISNTIFDEDYPILELDLDRFSDTRNQALENVDFAVDLVHTTQYNYLWLTGKGDPGYNFLPVDVNFLRKLKSNAIVLSLSHLPVFNEKQEIRQDYAEALKRYYHSVRLSDEAREDEMKSLKIALIWLRPLTGFAEKQEARAVDFLFQQMRFAHGLQKEGGSMLLTCSLALPGVSERAIVQSRFARIVFEALRRLEKEEPAHNQRLLLVNAYEKDNLCRSGGELIQLLRKIVDQNNISGAPIRNIGKKIGIAIDVAALFAIWQDRGLPFYKNRQGDPLSQAQWVEEISKEFTERDFQGAIVKRHIKALLVSYYDPNRQKVGELPYHYPFSRAQDSHRALDQLRLVLKLYELSSLRSDEGGTVVLQVPLRELFPVVHRTIKPLARAWNLYLMKDGADRWEYVYSFELVRRYLSTYVR